MGVRGGTGALEGLLPLADVTFAFFSSATGGGAALLAGSTGAVAFAIAMALSSNKAALSSREASIASGTGVPGIRRVPGEGNQKPCCSGLKQDTIQGADRAVAGSVWACMTQRFGDRSAPGVRRTPDGLPHENKDRSWLIDGSFRGELQSGGSWLATRSG